MLWTFWLQYDATTTQNVWCQHINIGIPRHTNSWIPSHNDSRCICIVASYFSFLVLMRHILIIQPNTTPKLEVKAKIGTVVPTHLIKPWFFGPLCCQTICFKVSTNNITEKRKGKKEGEETSAVISQNTVLLGFIITLSEIPRICSILSDSY